MQFKIIEWERVQKIPTSAGGFRRLSVQARNGFRRLSAEGLKALVDDRVR